jgi:hypothetical protein
LRTVEFLTRSDFLEYVEEDELEVMYGGKNTWKYNYDDHWNKEETL